MQDTHLNNRKPLNVEDKLMFFLPQTERAVAVHKDNVKKLKRRAK